MWLEKIYALFIIFANFKSDINYFWLNVLFKCPVFSILFWCVSIFVNYNWCLFSVLIPVAWISLLNQNIFDLQCNFKVYKC